MSSQNEQNDLKKIIEAFRTEAIWMRRCYNVHVDFFDNDQNGKILRETAGLFFEDFSKILKEYFLLSVGRITDPEKSFGKENLSVSCIITKLKEKNCLTESITKLGVGLNQYSELTRVARNKIIAHSDLEVNQSMTELGKHTEQELVDFMDSLQKFCDEIAVAVKLQPCDFSTQPGDGDHITLLQILGDRARNNDRQ